MDWTRWLGRRPRAFWIAVCNLVGLVCSLVGVVLLFEFALPVHVPGAPGFLAVPGEQSSSTTMTYMPTGVWRSSLSGRCVRLFRRCVWQSGAPEGVGRRPRWDPSVASHPEV